MKRIIVRASMLTAALMLAGGNVYAGCNNLTVRVNSTTWNVDQNNVTCDHGHVETFDAKTVVMTNTGYYGPDCRIGFLNPQGQQQAVVEFQQNYCFMEAGDITVTPLGGPTPQYNAQEGSWKDGTGGQVTVNGFSATASASAKTQFE